MKLTPYTQVDDTLFTATRDEVRERHGHPLSEGCNEVGLIALDYGDVVFRFQHAQAGGRLEEITAQAPVLHMGNVAVPFSCLASFVRAQDPAAFERLGFWVSPKYGLAFVPGEPDWVTALARHSLPQWLALSQG